MKTASCIGFLIGLAVITGLVLWQGVAAIADRFTVANWSLLAVAIFALPEITFSAASWRQLFPPGTAPRFLTLLHGMWMGTAVNALLPVATIGGEVVKVRRLLRCRVAGVDAAASVVVDKTVQAISVFLWSIVGMVMLAILAPGESIFTTVIVGSILLAVGIAGFIMVQRAGAFAFLARFGARLASHERWGGIVDSAQALDRAIKELYRRPGAITKSSLLRFCARAVLALEVWLVAWLIGYPIGLAEAIMIKSLGMAVRSVAFVVPGGLGLQEGSYVVLGALIGLPPDVMLSVSLATRIRELAEGIPGLIALEHFEGRAFLRQKSAVRQGTRAGVESD